jgi:hypothetical protein
MLCQKKVNPEFSQIVFDDLWRRGLVSCPHKPHVGDEGYHVDKKLKDWCPFLLEHVVSE